MTRKDFILLSSAIYRSAKPERSTDPDYCDGIKDCAMAIGEAIQNDHNGFDLERFMRDCGVE